MTTQSINILVDCGSHLRPAGAEQIYSRGRRLQNTGDNVDCDRNDDDIEEKRHYAVQCDKASHTAC